MLVDEKRWHRARLIPVTGIKGSAEQERRAASVFLSVMRAVREFGRSLTTRMGAPAGIIEAYTEVEFALGQRKVRPDGLIRVRGRGNKIWIALLEVKTGRDVLQANQVEDYLEVARLHNFDAVVTVSTQLPHQPGVHPLAIDRRKTKKVALHHLSWSEIHAEASIEELNHSVTDPVQAWILGEFVRYLAEPNSGAADFSDMGTSWTAVRDAAANRTLRGTDLGVRETVRRFGQLVSFAGMQLSQQLGVPVRTGVTRKDIDDPVAHLHAQVAEFVDTGRLVGTLVVPEAFGPIEVVGDLRSSKISCALAVPAPRNRKTPRGQVTWLTGQLQDPPADLLLQAGPARARQPGPTCTVAAALEDPLVALDGTKVELRELRLSLIRSAGLKRGRGRGSFIDSVVDLVGEFYECVVQDLKPVAPVAPKVKARDTASEETAAGVPGTPGGAIAALDEAGSDPGEEPVGLEPDDVGPTSALPSSATEPEHLVRGGAEPASSLPLGVLRRECCHRRRFRPLSRSLFSEPMGTRWVTTPFDVPTTWLVEVGALAPRNKIEARPWEQPRRWGGSASAVSRLCPPPPRGGALMAPECAERKRRRATA